ncbi:MAG: DEAD/DEAH box helicase family protein [Tepidisphaeraceae bacterium]
MELRDYQGRVLEALKKYLQDVPARGAKAAFVLATERPYRDVPQMEQMPYVCLRLPTGGGKTLVACYAIGETAREYLQTDHPTVLWLAPSNTIVNQTLRALRDHQHPYRRQLDEQFAGNVKVMEIAEALYVTRADLSGAACVIVTTFQALRVDNTDGRKVYESNGQLQHHFDGLPSMLLALFTRPDGSVDYSLANVLTMRRPLIVMDEAHNARTPLSFTTLARFHPSAILELTATPETTHDPARERYASNVLAQASALELKNAEMIKLPIKLRTRPDWRLVVHDALDTCRQLAEQAARERAATGEYIRPIALFQAESVNGDDMNVDRLRQALIEDFQVSAAQIAIHTGTTPGLNGVDVASEACPITCIITVKALVEGWDCPFAYVLCSLSGVSTPRAVEQVLGRILRLPGAKRKTHDALNCAYAFAVSENFIRTAQNLRDALVEGAGFQRLEAQDLVVEIVGPQPGLFDRRVPVSSMPTLGALSPSLFQRVTFEPTRRELVVSGPVNAAEVQEITRCFSEQSDREAITRLILPDAPRIPTGVDRGPFRVPGLSVRVDGQLELFDDTHLLDVPWNIAECPANLDEAAFPSEAPAGMTGEIDVTDRGRVELTGFVDQLHRDLSLFGAEPGWTLPTLTAWLSQRVASHDLVPSQLRLFVLSALESLMRDRAWTIDRLAGEKYRLAKAIEAAIDRHRVSKRLQAFQNLLFGPQATVEVDPEQCLTISPEWYAPNSYYEGDYHWQRHAFPRVGELKSEGEEFECATRIDQHPNVRRWVRNLERQSRHSFWLQTSTDRFYPDFVVELLDGRFLVVEYKRGDSWSNDDNREKRKIGELWAAASHGRCLFIMPKGPDWPALHAALNA